MGQVIAAISQFKDRVIGQWFIEHRVQCLAINASFISTTANVYSYVTNCNADKNMNDKKMDPNLKEHFHADVSIIRKLKIDAGGLTVIITCSCYYSLCCQ